MFSWVRSSDQRRQPRKWCSDIDSYRAYEIDPKGATISLTNFTATDDAEACATAAGLMTTGNWAGLDLWERFRQVHCAGTTRRHPQSPLS